MTTGSGAFLVPLTLMVICAALIDARSRRIPNWLTASGVVLALLSHTIAQGWSGLRFSAVGMLAGFSLYLGLYAIRALGAGDVKLMAAVGAFAGVSLWFQMFVITAIVGAMAALVLAIVRRKVRSTVWNAAFIASELLHWRAPYISNNTLDVRNPAAMKLPHGVAVAFGVGIVLILQGTDLHRHLLGAFQ